MTPMPFTFSAKLFSREYLDAPQKPVEHFSGTLIAENYSAAKEKAASKIRSRCNEIERQIGLMVGFEKLTVELDDSPTEERIREHAAKLLTEIESHELSRSTFNWQYQQHAGLFLTYQLAYEILTGKLPKSVLDTPVPSLVESLNAGPTEPLHEGG